MSDLPWIILQERGRTGSELSCPNSPGKALQTPAKCCSFSNHGEKGEEEKEEEGGPGEKKRSITE